MTQRERDKIKELREEIKSLKQQTRQFSVSELNLLHDGATDTIETIGTSFHVPKETKSYCKKVQHLRSKIESMLNTHKSGLKNE